MSFMQYAKYTFYALLDSISCLGNKCALRPLHTKSFLSQQECAGILCGLISECVDVLVCYVCVTAALEMWL